MLKELHGPNGCGFKSRHPATGVAQLDRALEKRFFDPLSPPPCCEDLVVKKLLRRGRDVELPVIGDMVIELRFRDQGLPVLIMAGPDSLQSEFRFEGKLTLIRGQREETMTAGMMQHGTRLLEVLGDEVTTAAAEYNGKLSLSFSSGLVLESRSVAGFEHWHFLCPRPGYTRPVRSAVQISVTGAGDGLIIFDKQ